MSWLKNSNYSVQHTSSRVQDIVVFAFLGVMFIFLLAPIIIVIVMSFNDALYLSFPPKALSLKWYERYFSDPIYLQSS